MPTKAVYGVTIEGLQTVKGNVMDDRTRELERAVEIVRLYQAELAEARATLARHVELCDARIRESDEISRKMAAHPSAEEIAAAQARRKELDLEGQALRESSLRAREEADRRAKNFAALMAEYS